MSLTAMDDQFAPLLEPGRIGKLRLKNRVIMTAMGTLQENTDGSMSLPQFDFFEERARGGVAMIVTGGQLVTNKFDAWSFGMTALDSDVQTRAWRQLNDRVKAFGVRTCVQLSCGLGRAGFPVAGIDAPIRSASEVPAFHIPGQTCQAFTLEEIQFLIDANARSAARAMRAGFDAVQIHGHVGYILDQFMSDIWNKRTDAYGGSFENRMRLPRDIIAAIRAVIGPDAPIIFRFSLDHRFPGGRSVEDGLAIMRHLENETSVDAFDINVGAYESHHLITYGSYMGDACLLDAAKIAKAHTRLPVMNAGSFTPETAAAALRNGELDFISMGRPLLAEPEWVNKLIQGKRADVRPCIRCNEYCLNAVEFGMVASCAVNARVGAERNYPIVPTTAPKHIVVVGGGPAGLEAARVAALKGHRVDLHEKGAYLGGVFAFATAPFKSQLKAWLAWVTGQLEKLGVIIHLNSEITPTSAVLSGADKIIVAIGSMITKPDTPGIDLPHVMTVREALSTRRGELGQRIIVIGGEKPGSDFALEMALEGKAVTLIESGDAIQASAHRDDRTHVTLQLEAHGAQILTRHQVTAITPEGVTVAGPDGQTRLIPGDSIAYYVGRTSNRAPTEAIADLHPQAVAIGDCSEIGVIGAAIRRGFFTAWSID